MRGEGRGGNLVTGVGTEGGEEILAHGKDQPKEVQEVLIDLKRIFGYDILPILKCKPFPG